MALAAGLGLGAMGCGGSSTDVATTTTAATTTTVATTTTLAKATGSVELGDVDRPARLVAPETVTAPAPLLVLLHGYTSNAEFADQYLAVTQQAASRGLYVLLASGTKDALGRQFWDATAACCNSLGAPVDDVGYLGGLIDAALAARPIDPTRVYVLGHSNGGFMAYRLACERADQIAAVAVLAGSDAASAGDCAPSRPVSVLHLHGTADDIVPYAGGRIPAALGDFSGSFPGAVEVITRWAARDGCDPQAVVGEPLDLDAGVAGAETVVSIYEGCAGGVDVQLDTITAGGHLPALAPDRVGVDVLDWLVAQGG